MAMDETTGAAGARPPRKTPVRYSARLAVAICERVAAGELLYRVCREAGMPTPEGVARCVKARPDFAAALLEARRAGGRLGKRGMPFGYCPELADEIFERLCEGESLTAIGKDPTMPSLSTIFYWRRRIPEFEQAVQAGKRIQGERFCDLGWEIATEATPETAFLTQVRLQQLRWTATMLAPRVFKLKNVEPEVVEEPTRVLIRTFKIETDPVTGKDRVVAYCPNPDTGRAEREDDEGWRPPPGIRLPG
jgi:hypothetical protein